MRFKALYEETATSRNVANVPEIEAAAAQLLGQAAGPNAENVKKWIKQNFRNYMIRDYPGRPPGAVVPKGEDPMGAKRIKVPLDGLPDWMLKKAKQLGITLQQFLDQNLIVWVRITPEFMDEMRHVIDVLNTTQGPQPARPATPATAEAPARPAQPARPAEDLTRLQVPVAIERAREADRRAQKAADKAEKEALKKGGKEVSSEVEYDPVFDDREATHVLMTYDNGWHWVKLLEANDATFKNKLMLKQIPKSVRAGNWELNSPNPAFRRESFFQQHCIGAGYGYDEKNRKGTHHYYSLRDNRNMPKVTIESEAGDRITGMRGKILQIQGYGNATPAATYNPYIADFIKKGKMKADPNTTKRMGLIQFGDELLTPAELQALPREDLARLNPSRSQLRDMKLFRIGDTLYSMEDGANLSREVLEKSDLTPEELEKMGFIKTDKGLMSWEEMHAGHKNGITIDRDVKFDNVIREIRLPPNLTINGNLQLKGFRGNQLPENLKVSKNFTMDSSEITIMPQRMMVGGSVSIKNTPIRNFPVDFACDNLELENTNIEMLERIKVRKNLTLKGGGVHALGPGCEIQGSVYAGQFNQPDAPAARLSQIAPDVVIGGNLYCARAPIKELNFAGVGGAVDAQSSGVVSIRPGFSTGGYVGRDHAKNVPEDTHHSGQLNLTGTKIKELPENLHVSGDLTLPTTVKVLPPGLQCLCLIVIRNQIKRLPPDMKFTCIMIKKASDAIDWQVLNYVPPGGKITLRDDQIRPGDPLPDPFEDD